MHPTIIGVAQPVIEIQTWRRLPVVLRPPLERVHIKIALWVASGDGTVARGYIAGDEVSQSPLRRAEAAVVGPGAGASVKREGPPRLAIVENVELRSPELAPEF